MPTLNPSPEDLGRVRIATRVPLMPQIVWRSRHPRLLQAAPRGEEGLRGTGGRRRLGPALSYLPGTHTDPVQIQPLIAQSLQDLLLVETLGKPASRDVDGSRRKECVRQCLRRALYAARKFGL